MAGTQPSPRVNVRTPWRRRPFSGVEVQPVHLFRSSVGVRDDRTSERGQEARRKTNRHSDNVEAPAVGKKRQLTVLDSFYGTNATGHQKGTSGKNTDTTDALVTFLLVLHPTPSLRQGFLLFSHPLSQFVVCSGGKKLSTFTQVQLEVLLLDLITSILCYSTLLLHYLTLSSAAFQIKILTRFYVKKHMISS